MSESGKAKVDIIINVEPGENTEEKDGQAGEGFAAGGVQAEMPTVTTLLRRRKLGGQNSPVIDTFTATGEASGTPAEPQQAAVEIPQPGAGELESAPSATEEEVAPAVTPSRRRAAARVVVEEQVEAQVVVENEPVASSAYAEQSAPEYVERQPGEPPVFRGTLVVEPVELKAFQKALKKHKKCTNMKKLDCLGYFATRFTEIAYFEVAQAGALQGVLGFGNTNLVLGVSRHTLTPNLLPGIFELLAQGEVFIGPIEGLRTEDQSGLLSIGFSPAQCVAIVPITYKKAITGLWICTAPDFIDVPPKEIKALKKQFTNFVL